MTTALVISAIWALCATAFGVWLWMARDRALREALSALESKREVDSRLEHREAELGEMRRVADQRAAETAELRTKAVQLHERLDGVEARHRETVAHLESSYQQRLESREAVMAERLSAVEQARDQISQANAELLRRMEQSFGKLATDALSKSSGDFLRLASEHFEKHQTKAVAEVEERKAQVDRLVKPIAESLKQTEELIKKVEVERLSQAARLEEQIRGVSVAHEKLSGETGRLVNALSKPEVRGRYGEIQLRRVAELAGMVGYCDFDEQSSARDSEGALQRPDMVVRLPNNRVVAVDAKTNTYAYVEAVNAATREEQERHLERFATHMSDQVGKLSAKSYWRSFEGSPEFVVMFVPGDQFLDAALARRPDLLEKAASVNVIIASPSTLIGLLRAVHVGWREHTLAQEAQELLKLGRELHERAAKVFFYADQLGGSLDQAVKRYNDLVGSIDKRLAPTLRRFEQSGASSGKSLTELKQVDRTPNVGVVGGGVGGGVGKMPALLGGSEGLVEDDGADAENEDEG